MAKQKTINRDYKTVFFDYDGTLFDTKEADQYVARQKTQSTCASPLHSKSSTSCALRLIPRARPLDH